MVAQTVGTPFLILAVWIAGGLIALAGAFVFAELSTVMPRVGGQYAFFREAFHPLVAFLHGWSLLLIIQSGRNGSGRSRLRGICCAAHALPGQLVTPLAVTMMLALSAFHALGIKPGAVLINVITFGKTLAIAALIVGAFALTKRSGINFEPLTPPTLTGFPLVSAFFAGLVPVMFSYGGWQNLNFIAEEVRDPLRNLPRAILIGVFLRDRRLREREHRLRFTCSPRLSWRPRKLRRLTWPRNSWASAARKSSACLSPFRLSGF